jgi:hypothetical protein
MPGKGEPGDFRRAPRSRARGCVATRGTRDTLVYYSKPDCPLCDKSWPVAEALAVRHRLGLEEVDIRSDPSLERRYGERIPVLLLGDAELGWGCLSPRALERSLDRALAERSGGDSNA